MDKFMIEALNEARLSLKEGGIPIGAVLVVDGKIIGRGRNKRVQENSVIKHAEMDCLENAGRLKSETYRRATLYTTLSPCEMCSGAILLYGIKEVVIGENENFKGPEEYLKSKDVNLTVLNDSRCKELFKEFIRQHPELWLEDIGR